MDPSGNESDPQAGPSNAPPVVFPAPQPFPHPVQHLHSTQDLLAVFNLLPAYDKYVRPHVRPIVEPSSAKGKGKEREVPTTDAARQDRDVEEEEGGDKKKKKDSYRHLIKRTPGKHSMKKDNYFQTLMAAPPKQKMQIQFIDTKTLREGFGVTLTGLPSYNKASLEGTDPKEKEAKKLKKERRKAEKEERLRQQQRVRGSGSNASTPAAATPSSSVTHVRNISASTPTTKGKPPVVARPSPTRSGTPTVSASGTPTVSASGVQSTTAPTPTPPHQATVTAAVGRVASNPIGTTGRPPQANGTGAATVNTVTEKRGKKRELEVQHPPTPGQVPQKKRRVGSNTPQATPLQQPTPHGS